MPLPKYVTRAIGKQTGLPDYVKAQIQQPLLEPSQDIGTIQPGSISTITGKPLTEGDIARMKASESVKTLGTTISNIPSSGVRFGKETLSGIGQIITSPIQTGKAVGGVALGALQKLIPGEQDAEKYADAFGRIYADRYGSSDRLRETIVNDPVGVLADFAMFLTGGGAAVRGVGTVGKAAKISQAGKLAEAGKMMQKVGAAIEPLNIAKKTVSPVTKLIPEKLPRSLYKGAAKFKAATEVERNRLADTAIKHGVEPTIKGVEKINNLIDSLDRKIDNIIKTAIKENKRIPKGRLFKHLKDLRREMGGVKLEGKKDLRLINNVAKVFNEHLKKIKKSSLTPEEVQKFKQDVYRRVRFDRKRGTLTLPKERTAKALARAAKEELEALHPEIKKLNKQDGALRALLDEIEARAKVVEGNQLVTFDAPVKAAAGKSIAGPAGQIVGGSAGILEMPRVKAKVALALARARKYKPKRNLSATTARLIAREAGREDNEQ